MEKFWQWSGSLALCGVVCYALYVLYRIFISTSAFAKVVLLS
jgi:hypothetical protein